jgi:sulfatase modifying factor 1
MKLKFTKTAFVVCLLGVVVSSCKQKQRSDKTGRILNDKTNGGFQVFRKNNPAPGPGLIAIEGGTFVMGGSQDQDVQYDYIGKVRRSIRSFYMDETEVSNLNWREYVHWISLNFPNDHELYYNALPDTLVWRRPLSYNEPYVNEYFRHTAFQDYPVVGVTWEQAQDFCEWRTDAVNENILRETGRLADYKTASNNGKKNPSTGNGQPFNTDLYLNNQIKGKGVDGKNMMTDLNPNAKAGPNGRAVRPVSAEDGILKAHYRLPSEAEWEYAALGIVAQDENIAEGKMYPWYGMGVRSPKKQTRGMILANFKRSSGDFMGVAGSLNDKADITAPVRSYMPNDFGLYNMAGNVNEWTRDTYRQSYEELEGLNPFRGNEYSNLKMSDPEKGILAKNEHGRPVYEPATSQHKLTWAEHIAQLGQTPGATGTGAAGNASAATKTADASANKYAPMNASGKPYKADQRGFRDTTNSVLYGTTTLVNDRSKVYKGGSWNDMAYWLNPATRRFMDQGDASAEVGFRCAMDMEGSGEISPQGKSHFRVKKPAKYTPK